MLRNAIRRYMPSTHGLIHRDAEEVYRPVVESRAVAVNIEKRHGDGVYAPCVRAVRVKRGAHKRTVEALRRHHRKPVKLKSTTTSTSGEGWYLSFFSKSIRPTERFTSEMPPQRRISAEGAGQPHGTHDAHIKVSHG